MISKGDKTKKSRSLAVALLKLTSALLSLVLVLPAQVQAADSKCTEKETKTCIEEATALLNKGKLEEGKALLLKGCDGNDARACLKAGIMEEKYGNKDKAKEFYKKSCELKKEDPCKNLQILESGSKGKK